MNPRFVACGQSFTVFALALLACGCATPALWKHTAAQTWQPPSSPDQFLATTTAGRHDVVVVFRQTTVVGDKAKQRVVAWNLSHPPLELTVGRHSLRQLTNTCDRVQLMPVFSRDKIPADATSTPPGYAVLDGFSGRFTVHLDGVASEPLELPVSHQECRSLERIAGMPFAIATDAAIVGAIVGGGLIGGAGGIRAGP